MERKGSFGASWADQWDYGKPYPEPEKKERTASKYGKKVGVGLEKTKAVAATGMRKVKEGATVGLHWIKEKYNKKTQKH